MNKKGLIEQSESVTKAINSQSSQEGTEASGMLTEAAIEQFLHSFDRKNGGFGRAPKFPTPHNLIFLLNQARGKCLEMADKEGGFYSALDADMAVIHKQGEKPEYHVCKGHSCLPPTDSLKQCVQSVLRR